MRLACLLVVDDDEQQLRLRRHLLEQAGHEVHTALDVPEAIGLLRAIETDVLIMDLRMPEVRDGLDLIRRVNERRRPPRIVVLSGWPEELEDRPEGALVSRILAKPLRTEKLLQAIRDVLAFLCLLICSQPALTAEEFSFDVGAPAEVIADLDMSSPGSDWSRSGREAALASLTVDGSRMQHVMTYAGVERHTYSAFLGNLSPGRHQLRIERDAKFSAPDAALKVWSVRFRQVARGDPYWPVLAHAPVLFARADTVGGFSDLPLISYCERLEDGGAPLLQYTVIFSNEDGGTSTRALMARWGRTTDIEYVYRARLDSSGNLRRATIQAKDHKEIAFSGRLADLHPLLIPSTRNNMVSPAGRSPIRYQIPPLEVNLSGHSREQAMDEQPVAWRVMAQELIREHKLREYGRVEGEKIGDPRNYLYVEAKVANRDSALATLVRLDGEKVWRSSTLGRPDYAIERDGWIRTAVELPPGSQAAQVAGIAFECLTAHTDPLPLSGVCSVERGSKAFVLGPDYRPGPSIFRLDTPATIASGSMQVFAVPPRAR